MKQIILTSFICLFAFAGYAQQDAQYTQFIFNKLALNPAYAGSKEVASVSVLYRNQWIGLEGAPKTQTINFHAPFLKKKLGLGLSIVHDKIGLSNNWTINTMYSYRIPIKENTLSFGIQAGVRHMGMNWGESTTTQIGDGSLPMDRESILMPNVGFGAYFSAKKYYVGFSIPHLIDNTYNFEGTDVSPDATSFAAQTRHYMLMGGAIFNISDNVKFKPAMLFKYVPNAPLDIDFNASFLFANRIWAGATYRLGDSFDLLAQYEITRQLKAGIAYDFTLTELRQYNAGSFEIMLEYNFFFEQEKLKNPRFFF